MRPRWRLSWAGELRPNNLAAMVPAIVKAPFDFLFALVIAAGAIGMSFDCDPRTTGWIVFGVGVLMAVTIVAAALRPVPRD